MPDPDDPERWLAGEMKCVQHSSSCAMRTFAQHEVSATARGPSSRERWSNQRQISGSMVDCRISGSAEASAATNIEQEANDKRQDSCLAGGCHRAKGTGSAASQHAGRWLDCLPLLGSTK